MISNIPNHIIGTTIHFARRICGALVVSAILQVTIVFAGVVTFNPFPSSRADTPVEQFSKIGPSSSEYRWLISGSRFSSLLGESKQLVIASRSHSHEWFTDPSEVRKHTALFPLWAELMLREEWKTSDAPTWDWHGVATYGFPLPFVSSRYELDPKALRVVSIGWSLPASWRLFSEDSPVPLAVPYVIDFRTMSLSIVLLTPLTYFIYITLIRSARFVFSHFKSE